MDTPTLYIILIRLLRLACQRNPPQSAVYHSLRGALDLLEDTTGTERTYLSRASQRAARRARVAS